MSDVISTVLCFSVRRWSTQYHASWHWTGFTFLKGKEGLCSWATRAHWQSFKLTWKEKSRNLGFPMLARALSLLHCTTGEVLQRWTRGSRSNSTQTAKPHKHQRNTSRELRCLPLRRWRICQQSWSAPTPMHTPSSTEEGGGSHYAGRT